MCIHRFAKFLAAICDFGSAVCYRGWMLRCWMGFSFFLIAFEIAFDHRGLCPDVFVSTVVVLSAASAKLFRCGPRLVNLIDHACFGPWLCCLQHLQIAIILSLNHHSQALLLHQVLLCWWWCYRRHERRFVVLYHSTGHLSPPLSSVLHPGLLRLLISQIQCRVLRCPQRL